MGHLSQENFPEKQLGLSEPQIIKIGIYVGTIIYLAEAISVKLTEHPRNDEAHDLSKIEKQILQACQDSPLSSSQLLDLLGYKSRTGNFRKALSKLL